MAAILEPSHRSIRRQARSGMRYLLVTHLPLAAGMSHGKFWVGDLLLEDLRAQAKEIRGVGGQLVGATPCLASFNQAGSGSFNAVEIDPAREGFEYCPLPYFISLMQYV